ncbi:DUF2306 domain-containing protein [Paenibacillus sp. ALJ109b]|nr:DUF2306 domain-containing protein [Paenibacillus sp. ALJ109b]
MTISRSLLFSLNCCFFISLFTFAGFHFAGLRSQRDSRRLIGNAPRLMNTKSAFRLLITVAASFVFWTLLNRFALDPDASVFLSHKTKLIRPMNLPVWLTMLNVHVIFACIAIAAGVINFASAKLRKYRKMHRILGYVYVVAVLAVCITSGYMAPFATGGKVVSIAFNLLNII